MALSTFVGSFAQPGSTGNQAVTGVGFQPSVVLFLYTPRTSDGLSAGASVCLGWANSSSSRGCVWSGALDGGALGDTDASRASKTTKCLTVYTPVGSSPTLLAEADFVSMDADGFTVNWTTADATARIVSFFALGGTDITNVATGNFNFPTSTGAKVVTGVGFRPDFVLFASINSGTAAEVADGSERLILGFAVSSSSQGLVSAIVNDANSSPADRYQRTTKCLAVPNASEVVAIEADFTSMDSDGFTLNFSTAAGGNYCLFLAIKGGQYKVGAFNQATSTGNQAVTGVGFQPTGLLFASFNAASTTSVLTSARLSLGFAASSSARAAAWSGVTDNQAVTSVADVALDRAQAIKLITEPSTVDAAADLVSLDTDGFTVNNGTVDATSRELLYLAVGSTPSGWGPLLGLARNRLVRMR